MTGSELMKASPKISVIVASIGRPDSIAVLLDRLASQTLLPLKVILSVVGEKDIPALHQYPFELETVLGSAGLCAQRNRGLDHLPPDMDLVIFYDDDFVPSSYSLHGLAEFFHTNADVAGATGIVLADGIGSVGITGEEACAIVDAFDAKGPERKLAVIRKLNGLYGCNMAYRASAIKGQRFDEHLPLYAWLEDLDFAARTGGLLVKTNAFSGVHCGEKRGRERSGRKLGYSQISNPIYLMRKGSLSIREGVASIARNFIANHLKLLRPEPWVDRKGRMAGNWLAIKDSLTGRIDPQRILDL